MQPVTQITAALLVLLLSGCATIVAPEPSVARDSDPREVILVVLDGPNPGVKMQPRAGSPVPAANEARSSAAALPVDVNDAPYFPTAGSVPVVYYFEEDFWERLRSYFQLSAHNHPDINQQAAEYAAHGYEVERKLQRGKPYLAYILGEVEKYGMPGEVVLLPFVESGYDPYAYSHGRAAGLWQFIPSTGKYYGLRQDWWHDERRDVVASTEAALEYLERLNRSFNGDWLLTFAAYNAGGGTVRKAIKRNRKAGKPTDFWNLDLPAETTAYVPRLLGISSLVQEPDFYGLNLPDIDLTPHFAVVETGKQLDIKVAAKLAGMKTSDFLAINPEFNRWSTHPHGPHQLAIPVDKVDAFISNLEQLPEEEHINWVRHKTVRGETLSHIARRYRTTVKELQHFNKLASTRINAGTHLLVPRQGTNTPRQVRSAGHRQYVEMPAGIISHKVNPGDSLWRIAKRYQVPLSELKEWNQLKADSLIKPGQKLIIRADGAATVNPEHMRVVYYTVRSGDSLSLISHKYKVSIADLRRWNELERDSYLQPGQKLTIHVDLTRLTQR